MYGTNPVAGFVHDYGWDEKYHVAEIFPTIQGEGPFSGLRSVFVRMSHCNLRCVWCDTDFSNVIEYRIFELSREIDTVAQLHFGGYPRPLIVITGGEPLLQPLDRLIKLLLEQGYNIQIETAGTIFRDCLTWFGIATVVSPKTPIIDPLVYANVHSWKYVISAKDEFCPHTGAPITATQPGARKARLALPPDYLDKEDIYLMPCEGPGEDDKANLAKIYELSMKHGYRASVRLQTLLGIR
jgi:7-carboxy-7-deazaguanine synthase